MACPVPGGCMNTSHDGPVSERLAVTKVGKIYRVGIKADFGA